MHARLLTLLGLLCCGTALAANYPVRASANGRYLVDASGNPFLMIGDSPHSIICNLSTADAATYLRNRATNGFNTLWVELLCTTCVDGRANGSLIDGATVPFTGTVSGGAYDLTTPNSTYWAHVDLIVIMAATNGIQLLLDSLETGDWTAVALANGTNRCRQYGQFLGTRYKDCTNIVWITGNDFQTWSTATNDLVVTSVAKGIQDEDPNHLQTSELDYFVSYSLEDANWSSIITLDSAYTYYPTYAECLTAYNAGAVPVLLEEANYEYETVGGIGELPPSLAVLRRQEYWSLLGGALAGHMYGNHYTWTFASGWQSYLNSPGMTNLQYFRNFFTNIAWYNLVPDQSHTFVTSGYGTYSSSGTIADNNYATACLSPDGTLGVVFDSAKTGLVVDMTKMVSSVTAQWFDPSVGTYSAVSGSPFANTGTHTFTPSGNNSAGDTDWVLLLTASAPTPFAGNVGGHFSVSGHFWLK